MSTNQDGPVVEDSHLRTGVPPRFQFGLGTLFWVMTATAIVCALLFPMPAEFAIPLMLFVSLALLPAVWTTVIIYGHGYRRTFGIGAMFPSGIFVLSMAFDHLNLFRWTSIRGDDFWARMLLLGFWVSSLLVGGVCTGVRRLVEKRPASPPDQGYGGRTGLRGPSQR
jgi:hypothetical protein